MADRGQRRCDALLDDGSGCKKFTGHRSRPRCSAHHQEYKNLNTKYKGLDETYHQITGEIKDLTSSEREIKLRVGTELVTCRTQVNHRFHSESSMGNRGHIRRILRIQSELRSLKVADSPSSALEGLAPVSANDTASASLNTPTAAALQVHRSIVDPDTPIELFSHLPDDHPGRILRSMNIEMRQHAIDALYKVVPALDDSDCNSSNAQSDEEVKLLHTFSEVLRFVLRGYIVWNADPDILEAAAHATSVGTFLRSRSSEELQTYIRFFTTFKEARPDTMHFLRDAICDYLHRHDSKTSVTILGATIADDAHRPKLTVQA